MKKEDKNIAMKPTKTAETRKQDKDVFEDSEIKFKQIFDSASIGILIAQSSYKNFLYSNQKMCEMLGYDKDEILKVNISDIHPEESLPYIFDQFDKIINKEISEMHNLPFKRKDQTVFFTDGNASYVILRGEECIVGMFRDITERYKAENLIRQRDSDLAEAQKVASLGSWSYDLNTQAVNWSEELYRVFDIGKEDFGGLYDSFLDRVHPEDKENVLESNRHALASGEPFEIEYRILTRDKQLKTIREIGYAKKDASDKITGLFGTAQDITGIRVTEERLTKSEKKFSSIFHFNPDPIAITEVATGKIIDVNEAFLRWTGYSREEVIGVSTQDLHIWGSPEDREKIISELQTTGEVKTTEIFLRQKNGNLRQMLFSASFVEIDQERYLLTFAHDITQRKHAEEKLRREEQQFRALAEQSPDMIVLIDRDIKVTYVNPAVERFLGRKKEEIIGSYLYNYPHPDDLDLVVNIFTTFFKDTSLNVQRAEVRLCDKDGAWHIVDAVGTNLVRDNVAEAVIVNLRDVTDRKRTEEKLLLIQKAVESTSDPIGISDPQGHHFYQNKAFSELFEYTAEELDAAGGGPAVYVNKAIGRKVFDTIMHGGSFNGEVEMLSRSGRKFAVSQRADAIKDEKGKIIGLIGINTDITERQQMENELRASETNFRHSLDESPLGVRISTLEGETIYANKAILDIYEYSSIEELKKIAIKERYTSKSYAEFLERKQKRLKGEFGPSEYEISIVRKNGEVRHLQVIRKEIFWNGKKQSQVIYQDITRRKLAEEKLQQTLESLKKAVGTTIQVLVSALESRDPYTAGHQFRSADLACAIATEMGLAQDKIEGISMAGCIHDIGKLSIPTEILSKPSKLTDLEFSLVKEHSQSGYEMLKNVESPWPLADIVHQHHERINGTGYPKKLKGNEILIEARIMAVADVVEAMASHRPYRASLGIEAAISEIEKNKGVLYDEAVVNACLRLFRNKNYQLS